MCDNFLCKIGVRNFVAVVIVRTQPCSGGPSLPLLSRPSPNFMLLLCGWYILDTLHKYLPSLRNNFTYIHTIHCIVQKWSFVSTISFFMVYMVYFLLSEGILVSIMRIPHIVIKVKLYLCLIKHHTMETYGGVESTAPHILMSALYGGEWTASHSGCFTLRKEPPVSCG
jgi:hypothetical protein